MDRCHENDELLLDFLYGLLELSDVERVKEHLSDCTVCRGSLSEAQSHRRLFAKAAQVYEDIPEFKLPADEAESEAEVPMILAAATLPMPARRPRSWLVPISFAAAAAVLIAIFGLRSLYMGGMAELQDSVAAAHKKIGANAAEGSTLQAKLESKQNEVLARLAAQSMHLVAMGPTVLEPEAHSPLRIIIQDLQGKPHDATVQIKLVEAKTQRAIFEKAVVASAGMATFHMPSFPFTEAGPAKLRISTIDGLDAIEETVRLTAPSLVTHLATNKVAYLPGELLFFRTVTLERFNLRPVAEKLRLKFVLRDAEGEPVKQFFGNTAAGGIAGGEIALADTMPAGEYVLEISDAGASGRMPVVRRMLNIVATENGKAVADNAEKIVLVDFFPEGGELIAGIESRVYYRVRDGRGMPVDFAGQLVIGERPVGSFSPGPAGSLGVFTLTPEMGSTYEARIIRPNLAPVSVPCKLHELVRELGVVLSVRGSEDALKAEIRNTASEKMLLAAVTCRGRVVDQQLFLAKPGKTEIVLTPIAEAHGVLRVTLYDGERPLAERLVYRPSKQYLKLSANRSLGVSPFGAQQVTMQLQAASEQDQPAPAWVLAYVADGKIARRPGSELAAHFFLGGDIDSPEALETTGIFAADNPKAHEAIDLFLGTVGWRRFVRPERAPTALAQAEQGKDSAKALFCRENGSLAKLQDRAAQAMTQAVAALQQDGVKERSRLIDERKQAELELSLASTELAAYRNRPQAWLRVAGGVLALVLLVVGAACVAWGFVQTSRRRFATPAFAGAAASLGMCLFLYALAGHLGGPADSPAGIAAGRGTVPDVEVKQVALARSAGMTFPTGYVPAFVPESTALQARLGQITQTTDAVLVAAADMKLRYKQALDREKGDNSMKVEPSKDPQFMVAPGALKKDDKGKTVDVKPAVPQPKPGAPPADMFAREYAFRQIQKGAIKQDLILWSPMVSLQKGSQQITFDLPSESASFRMFLFGHSADGRFGFLEDRWEAK